jgi:hypothetical protein
MYTQMVHPIPNGIPKWVHPYTQMVHPIPKWVHPTQMGTPYTQMGTHTNKQTINLK